MGRVVVVGPGPVIGEDWERISGKKTWRLNVGYVIGSFAAAVAKWRDPLVTERISDAKSFNSGTTPV
jgi:hypothetical protein